MSFLTTALGGGLLAGIFRKQLSKMFGDMGGHDEKLKKIETLSHGQKSLLKDLLKHPDVNLPKTQNQPLYKQGAGYLSSILSQDPEMMKQFEAPALRQFNEEIVPGLSERFAGMGAMNSSAFNQTMGQQAGSLAERLAAMRAGLGMQASQQGLGYAQVPFQQAYMNEGLNLNRMNLGLGTPAFGYNKIGYQPGIGQSIAGGVGQAIPSLLMSLFGG